MTDQHLIRLQQKLATRVELSWDNRDVRIIGGADAHPATASAVGVLVLLSFPSLAHIATVAVFGMFHSSYQPGLLSFRETPLLLHVLAKSDTLPDVLFCDGHGIAHPRRFGLASHLGVLTGIPTIGCAKSLLHGEVSELGPARGASTCIKSKSGEQLGTALRTRSNANAVYVSPGHLMDIRTATKFALECSPRFRVPEPLRLAHIEAKRTAKAYRKP